MGSEGHDKVLVVWTSGDRDVALNMVFMYAANAKRHGWWGDVNLLVWGPSQELLVQDVTLQSELAGMLADGVYVCACKACADRYSVTDRLEDLGIDVFYSGEFLTDWIKSPGYVVTF